MKSLFLALGTIVFASSLALAQAPAPSAAAAAPDAGHMKAAALPQCANIVPQCEKAGFEPGDHKKTGKGLWMDCVSKVAGGASIAGVSVPEAEAKSCADAAKAVHKEHKAAKGH